VARRWETALALALAVAACGEDGERVTTNQDTVELTYRMRDDLSDGELGHLRQILENRLAALGVDDPSIEVDGDLLHVDLPDGDGLSADGISDILGVTAELTFRPVLLSVPAAAEQDQTLVPTPRDEDMATKPVVLADSDETRYQLGPAEATGSIVEDADAELSPSGTWQIPLTLTPEGIDEFNAMAARCFPPSETCPTGQVAIVLDSVVHSAPTVQTATFKRDEIVIAGDFTEEEAKDLALVLRYGSLPTELELVQGS